MYSFEELNKMTKDKLKEMAEEKGIKLGKSHISQYVSGKTIPRKEILCFLYKFRKIAWETLHLRLDK